jgi:hypothetical protein
MSFEAIKPEVVTDTALGLLERATVLGRMVWRDAAGDFRGAKNDTITIRLPAYTKARKRDLRSGTQRSKDALYERSVDVQLTDNLYHVVEITDEELTLDIRNFERGVILPIGRAMVRGIEDEVALEMQGADYHWHLQLDQSNPHKSFARARRHLNDSNVPVDGRVAVVGSAVEELLLTNELFVRADQSGSTEALRRAQIGSIYGMPVFTAPRLDPEEAYVFHRTAYVLNLRAPMVPRGAPWGATREFEGWAMRLVQTINQDDPVDQVHADLFIGTNHVKDAGTFDADGKFEPAVNPNASPADEYFVRAVKIDFDGPPSA